MVTLQHPKSEDIWQIKDNKGWLDVKGYVGDDDWLHYTYDDAVTGRFGAGVARKTVYRRRPGSKRKKVVKAENTWVVAPTGSRGVVRYHTTREEAEADAKQLVKWDVLSGYRTEYLICELRSVALKHGKGARVYEVEETD